MSFYIPVVLLTHSIISKCHFIFVTKKIKERVNMYLVLKHSHNYEKYIEELKEEAYTGRLLVVV